MKPCFVVCSSRVCPLTPTWAACGTLWTNITWPSSTRLRPPSGCWWSTAASRCRSESVSSSPSSARPRPSVCVLNQLFKVGDTYLCFHRDKTLVFSLRLCRQVQARVPQGFGDGGGAHQPRGLALVLHCGGGGAMSCRRHLLANGNCKFKGIKRNNLHNLPENLQLSLFELFR